MSGVESGATGFHGVFPYLVSPVDADGRVKDEVLARLCERSDRSRRAWPHPARLDRRVRLSRLAPEPRRWSNVTLEAAAGRVPVVAGVAATTTAEAVRQAASSSGWAQPASSRSWKPISRCRRRRGRLFPGDRGRGRLPGRALHQSAVPAHRPLARRDRAPRGASTTSATSRTPRPTPAACSRS